MSNTSKMSKLSCDIITDLLPLYNDNVCSLATKEVVEEHITNCDNCKMVREQMEMSIPFSLTSESMEQNKTDGMELKRIAAFWNRSKFIAFAKGLIVATTICAAIYLGFVGLFQWNITKVPTDVVKITDISQMKNGSVAFHATLTDGYDLNQIAFTLDSGGNYYVTPLRPIIKSKEFAHIGLGNMYHTVDVKRLNNEQKEKRDRIQIEAVYWGSPEDRILVWKKGVVLPPANDALEAQYNFEQ
ncbi:zf-HC2 domain-containing protein [Paenibacillus sp. 481]|uniref:zf-HC2 domain-containing protein n=1 Tax=Paenibacillus sp. 481 TaxID=2835869 RepID=UPI001E56BCA1|nr:zf-HC2 domain-containing protein [Paenibacillus sp. 481]UHA75461.1 zf-HC2 domain-containing protein [Paenibacillus sp. 481]